MVLSTRFRDDTLISVMDFKVDIFSFLTQSLSLSQHGCQEEDLGTDKNGNRVRGL